MKLIKKIIAVSACVLMSHTASADFIEGTLGFSTADSPTDLWYWDSANEKVHTGDQEVNIATGDLAGLSGMSIPSVDFYYGSQFTGPTVLWTLGDFTFTLTSVKTLIDLDGIVLALSGIGILSDINNQYEDTKYDWSFTGNSLTNSGDLKVSEPSTIALLGLGLLGLAYSRKRK